MPYSPHAKPTPHNIRVRLRAATVAIDRAHELLQLHPHHNRLRHRVGLNTAYSLIEKVRSEVGQ